MKHSIPFAQLLVVMWASILGSVDGTSQTSLDVLESRVAYAVVKIITPFGTGMGTVIDAEGHILSTASVVKGATDSIIVKLSDGSSYRCDGIDKFSDLSTIGLAVLTCSQLAQREAVPIYTGPIKPLTDVVSVGYLGKVDFSVISGKVANTSSDKLMLDMNLAVGSVGAPILDRLGNLIGVVKNVNEGAEYVVSAVNSKVLREVLSRRKNIRYKTIAVYEEYEPLDVSGPASRKVAPEIIQLEDSLRKCNDRYYYAIQRAVNAEREFKAYRDSSQRFIKLELERVDREKNKVAEHERQLNARLADSRDLIDSASAARAELLSLNNELNIITNQLRRSRNDLLEQQSKNTTLQGEAATLQRSVRNLEDRKINLESVTIMPRLRFSARSSAVYQSLQDVGVRSSFLIGRGEIDLGVRYGYASQRDVGDAVGLYVAGNYTNHLSSALPSTHSSSDWGAFIDFNNRIRVLYGVGSSNDRIVPSFQKYTIMAASLKFSGTVAGAWGLHVQVVKPENSLTYNLGGGLWFSFGSNFLQL